MSCQLFAHETPARRTVTPCAVQTLRTRTFAALATIVLAFALMAVMSGCTSTAQNDSPAGPARPPAEVIDNLPDYSGLSYLELNGNVPYFEGETDLPEGYESYTSLDLLGRCGTAEACVGRDTMPTGERGDISEIHPSGWDQEFYDFVENEALYNRSHLIGWQLTAENANEANLITGTRHMNADIMEPLESEVGSYVRRTGNHVRYRVTPVFKDDELVARGVLMEAESVEDGGAGIRFCVYAYNVQPGVEINYETGANWKNGQSTQTDVLDASTVNGDVPAETLLPANSAKNQESSAADNPDAADTASSSEATDRANETAGNGTASESESAEHDYVLNTGSRKFHDPSCPSVQDISSSNRENFHGTRDELIADSYEPCGACRP